MRALFHIFLVLVAAGVLGACSDTCTENKNALPLAGFYVISDGTEQKVSIDSLEVRGIGAPGDSVLSRAGSSMSQIYLPFRIDSDTTEYVFIRRYGTFVSESKVTFVYSRTPRFVSVECGVSYMFDMRKIECSGNLIDSVTCPQGFIDNTAIENLKIYLAQE